MNPYPRDPRQSCRNSSAEHQARGLCSEPHIKDRELAPVSYANERYQHYDMALTC